MTKEEKDKNKIKDHNHVIEVTNNLIVVPGIGIASNSLEKMSMMALFSGSAVECFVKKYDDYCDEKIAVEAVKKAIKK